jgi:hypothetical protein
MAVALSVSPVMHADDAAGGVQLSPPASCNEQLMPKRTVEGRQIGQEECRMREAVVVDDSWPEVAKVLALDQTRTFRRIEIGLSGVLDGYAVKDGPRMVTFTSAPEFVFVQGGNKTEPQRGTLRYDMEMGASMALMFPEDGSWNGKLFLTLPGMGSYRFGTNKGWDRNYNPARPMGDITKYEKLMLSKGFAVAKTRRNHNNERVGDGDYTVRLDDGTILLDRNPADNPELIIGYAGVAQKMLEKRLGRKPSHTFWYGHSGGARLGRLVNYNNYRTQANIGPDGDTIIDGLLVDDSGAGLYLPQVFRNGEDILFRTDADKKMFVPQLEVVHQLYLNDRADPVPDWMSTSFQLNKYRNAQLIRDKGLGHRFRMYEVRGISHSGGENLVDQKRGTTDILPIWRLMDSFVDLLDAWVTKGVEPPPTRSDWLELGDVNRDHVNENVAISLPEMACPFGVYYPYPPGAGRDSSGSTAFAPFDGQGEEPFDGRFERTEGEPHLTLTPFADMNRNGYRDYRETVSQAWHRLGLLKPSESLTRASYVACVDRAVTSLTKERLLSPKIAAWYVEQAKTAAWPDWVK